MTDTTTEAKAAKSPSKLSVCKEIFAASTGQSRKDIIAKFISEAGCSTAGAATYYAICKKDAEASTDAVTKADADAEDKPAMPVPMRAKTAPAS